GQRGGRAGPAGDEDERRTLAREGLRHGPADPLGRAGHDRGLAREPPVGRCPRRHVPAQPNITLMPPGRLTPIGSDASGGDGPYTPALRAGDFVYVSGQGPLEPGTLTVLCETVAEQTTHTLRNVLVLVYTDRATAESIVRCG